MVAQQHDPFFANTVLHLWSCLSIPGVIMPLQNSLSALYISQAFPLFAPYLSDSDSTLRVEVPILLTAASAARSALYNSSSCKTVALMRREIKAQQQQEKAQGKQQPEREKQHQQQQNQRQQKQRQQQQQKNSRQEKAHAGHHHDQQQEPHRVRTASQPPGIHAQLCKLLTSSGYCSFLWAVTAAVATDLHRLADGISPCGGCQVPADHWALLPHSEAPYSQHDYATLQVLLRELGCELTSTYLMRPLMRLPELLKGIVEKGRKVAKPLAVQNKRSDPGVNGRSDPLGRPGITASSSSSSSSHNGSSSSGDMSSSSSNRTRHVQGSSSGGSSSSPTGGSSSISSSYGLKHGPTVPRLLLRLPSARGTAAAAALPPPTYERLQLVLEVLLLIWQSPSVLQAAAAKGNIIQPSYQGLDQLRWLHLLLVLLELAPQEAKQQLLEQRGTLIWRLLYEVLREGQDDNLWAFDGADYGLGEESSPNFTDKTRKQWPFMLQMDEQLGAAALGPGGRFADGSEARAGDTLTTVEVVVLMLQQLLLQPLSVEDVTAAAVREGQLLSTGSGERDSNRAERLNQPSLMVVVVVICMYFMLF